jgi:putative transposase
LAARIKTICETRVRYGYRRVQVLLRREGWTINQKRTRRIYNELGLQLRNKTPKRRVKAKLREDRAPATRPNDVWAMDFVHDQLATGRKIRVLTVVDTFSRFSPVVDPRFSYRAEHVVATLERVCAKVGYPRTICVDHGSEFISRDLDLWAYAKGVTLVFSRPGKPTDTDVVEKPFQEGAGVIFSERDLARGLLRHRAVKSAYAFSAFSTRTRSAARFSGML